MQKKEKNSVILVHGFMDNEQKMQAMERYLRDRGWNAFSVTLSPSYGKIGIDKLASQLDTIIRQRIADDVVFDLVGFSMGGLICRYYIQRLGGFNRVEHLITISTPHHGTLTGYLLNNEGAKQMRFESRFVKELNADVDKLHKLKFLSIWSPFDLMILPASSSHIHNVSERKIAVFLHPLMVWNKKCFHAIESELLQ